MDGFAGGAVLLRVAAILDLLERASLGCELHDLEFEQPDPAVELKSQVDSALIAGILRCQVQSRGGNVAVEDAGIEAFVPSDRVAVMPLMRNGCEERFDMGT